MILSLVLPLALPVIAVICLLGAFFPSPLTRALLIATGVVLLAFSFWYVAVFVLGIM